MNYALRILLCKTYSKSWSIREKECNYFQDIVSNLLVSQFRTEVFNCKNNF